MHKAATGTAVLAAVAASFLLLVGAAGAQTTSCASFTTRAQAQAFYESHKNDDPNNPDPFHMDADGDGEACENYPYAQAATPAPTVAPVATTAPTIPKNGIETGVMALSGLSLLEAGYGMTLLAKRLGVKSRQVPVFLLRKLVSAGRSGQATVALGDNVFLVHSSALVATAEDFYHYVDLDEEDEADDSIFMSPAEPPRVNVYAALAKGEEIEDITPDDAPDAGFTWRF